VTQDFSAPPNITKQAGLQYIRIQALNWNDTTGKNNWNLATILNFQDLQLQVSEENKKAYGFCMFQPYLSSTPSLRRETLPLGGETFSFST